jgi:hypothetical protein
MYKGWSAFNSLLLLFFILVIWAGISAYLDGLDYIRVMALAPSCDGVWCVLYKVGYAVPKVYRYKTQFTLYNYTGDFPTFAINYGGAWLITIAFIIIAQTQVAYWASEGLKIDWGTFTLNQEKSFRNVQHLMLVVGLMMLFDNFIGSGIYFAAGAPLSERLGYKTYLLRPPIELSVMYMCFCFWSVFRRKKRLTQQ